MSVVLRVDWAAWAVTEAEQRRAMGPSAFQIAGFERYPFRERSSPQQQERIAKLGARLRAEREAAEPKPAPVITLDVVRMRRQFEERRERERTLQDAAYLSAELGAWARKQREKAGQ